MFVNIRAAMECAAVCIFSVVVHKDCGIPRPVAPAHWDADWEWL